nr:hypothetical protein [Tanacetum cinerariifolium]
MKKSSSLENEPCCSKDCTKNTQTLNKNIIDLKDKLFDANNMIFHYKLDDTITNYSRPSPAIESTLDDAQNKYPSVTKTEASDSTILSKLAIKFVKAVDRAVERSTTTKVEAVKKSFMRYAKLYRKPFKKPNVILDEESLVALMISTWILDDDLADLSDMNPIRTLGDYSKPSNEGYRNTIKLPEGNNMVPLLSDTIRTAKLCNDIRMFQQHQGESLSEAWNRFKDLLRKTVNYTAGDRLRKISAKKAWATIEELTRYEDEGWNDPVTVGEGSLDYENLNIEQLLRVIECKVDTLMKEAISLMGRRVYLE